MKFAAGMNATAASTIRAMIVLPIRNASSLVSSVRATMSPVTRFITWPRGSVAQQSCPAAQKLDSPPADAAHETALRIAVAGAVATKGVVVGFRNQQAPFGTWQRTDGVCQDGHGGGHARAAGPRPEHHHDRPGKRRRCAATSRTGLADC